MERIHYDLQTTKNQLKGNDTVAIILDFSEFTYKEVKNLQGMDLQTLIGKVVSSNILLSYTVTDLISQIRNVYLLFLGNAGGYLGLFLGYAVLNIPDILQEAVDWLYSNRNAMKRKTIVTVGSGMLRSN